MKRKFYIGMGVLLVLIIGISVVMLTRTTDTEPLNPNQTLKTKDNPLPDVTGDKQIDDNAGQTIKIVEDDRFSGMSLQSKVAASDRVPTYVSLKAMSQEDLSELMRASYAKAKTYHAEVNKGWDAWIDAPAGSDKEKTLKTSLDKVLTEQLVHSITGSKAFDVFYWRSTLQVQDNPLPNLVVKPIPEPIDP